VTSQKVKAGNSHVTSGVTCSFKLEPAQGLLHRCAPISFGSCANSFSKKEPAKYCSSIAAR
jgi:hypothetical protein